MVIIAPPNDITPRTTRTMNQLLKFPMRSAKSQLQLSLSLRFNAEKLTGLSDINLVSSVAATGRFFVVFVGFFTNLYVIVYVKSCPSYDPAALKNCINRALPVETIGTCKQYQKNQTQDRENNIS